MIITKKKLKKSVTFRYKSLENFKSEFESEFLKNKKYFYRYIIMFNHTKKFVMILF